MTSSNGNIFRVTGHLCGVFTGPGELPTRRPVTRSFDVFFDLRLNKRLSKQWWDWWFETLSHPLWRHRNGIKHSLTGSQLQPERSSNQTFKWIISGVLCQEKISGAGHYGDVIMGAITSQITSLMIVYSTVYSDADQRKHQSAASLAFVRRIHRGPVNSPRKCPVTRKMFPFDDDIMDKKCYRTDFAGYNYLFLSSIPASGRALFILGITLTPKRMTNYCIRYRNSFSWI